MRVGNDRIGFCAILRWISSQTVTRIDYEPTGAYHKAFERLMSFHALPVSKVNPRLAGRFAQATGMLAKTDQIDARMLALYGALPEPRLLQENSKTISVLKELHVAPLALIKDRTAAKKRQNTLTLAPLKRQNAARLKQIESQIEQIHTLIMEQITADATLKARFDILVSIPGPSAITAFTLLIEMPDLGHLDEKAAACLCGLAPMSRQSGRWAAHTFIKGGKAVVRQALYMPALVAARFNPDLKAKYQALKKAEKPPKVAITAIMRKLIILANALFLQMPSCEKIQNG